MLESTYKTARCIHKALKAARIKQAQTEDTLWHLERGYVFVETGTIDDAIAAGKNALEEIGRVRQNLQMAFDAI